MTLPSTSASCICSDTITGIPSTAPSIPVSSVALGPSLSIVLNWLIDCARMNVFTSMTQASSDGLAPYLPSFDLISLNMSSETAAP